MSTPRMSLTHCPLCKTAGTGVLLHKRDEMISREDFRIDRCGSCGFVFTADPPFPEDIHRYYDSSAYLFHQTENPHWMRRVARVVQSLLRQPWKRRWIARLAGKKTGRLLDFGCGTGEFAAMMRDSGWDVMAIEPNDRIRTRCRERLWLDARDLDSCAALPDASFDVITLWHVLEHVHDVRATLTLIRRLLKPGGTAIVAVPNIDSLSERLYGDDWIIWEPPRHLSFFTPKTMQAYAEETGWTITACRPLLLDSFYIALHSELLRGGSLLRGLLYGFLDFCSGLLRPGRASSLAFVLRADPVTRQRHPMGRIADTLLFPVGGWIVRAWGRIWMRMFGCAVHRSARIYGRPVLWRHRGHLSVGERTVINSLPAIYEFGQEFPRCIFSSYPQAEITIGNDCSVAGAAFHARRGIAVGNRVMIAAGCRITDSNFHPVDIVPRRYLIDADPSPVTLEDDVWLCAEVTVGRGVRIGRGSVIGTKSVVTRDIPPMVLAAGAPARVIRPLRIEEKT